MWIRRLLDYALWPLALLAALVVGTGRLMFYLFLFSNPLTMAIWWMCRHPKYPKKEVDHDSPLFRDRRRRRSA